MIVRLGDIARECRDTWKASREDVPIVALEHMESGDVRLSAWDVNSENTFSKAFRAGQVLLGRRRVYLKKAVQATFDGICSGDITVIEALEGKLLPELLPFIIQNNRFFDYAEQGSAGSLSPRVKWGYLANYEFDLPPIEEQKVLADKLWSAYRLKESYKKLLTASQDMVKAQFKKMFDVIPLDIQMQKGDVMKECLDITSKATKIPASEYQKTGSYPIFDQAQDSYIAGYTNKNDVLCHEIPCVLFGDHSRVVKYINQPFCIGADGVKLLKSKSLSLDSKFLYYDLLYHEIPNTGYNRHFKYLKQIQMTKAPLEKQQEFVAVAEQAEKAQAELKKSIATIEKVIESLINQ